MDTTTQLTGIIPAILIIAGIFTAIASWYFLRLFKRSTVKGMAKLSGFATPAQFDESQAAKLPELQFHTIKGSSSEKYSGNTAGDNTINGYKRLIKSYLWAGVCYALFFALAYNLIAGGGWAPGRYVWLLICFAWPTALSLYLIKNPWVNIGRRPLLVYAVVFLIIFFITAIRNAEVGYFELAFFWIWVNVPASLLLSTFLRKKVRAVGPLVLAFMILAVTGAFLAVEVVAGSTTSLYLLSEFGSAFGLGGIVLFLLILITGFLVLGALGWLVLKKIGVRYKVKRFSDQSLFLDSLWLIFGIAQSFSLAFEGIYWIFTGLIAFVIYKLVSRSLMKRIRSDIENDAPLLLYLRVFALGIRSEKLFDRISKGWRYKGSVNLISGPDLINSAVEPHEFLDFLGGRLSRQFVSNENDLNRRISAIDTTPDPDGRYRINSFFCRADNWKMTMQQLSQKSNATLMDLRSFSSRNLGCLYEIGQLFNLVMLDKIIFLIDPSTDLAFLKEKMEKLWEEVNSDSPNSNLKTPTVTFYSVQNIKKPEALYRELSVRT